MWLFRIPGTQKRRGMSWWYGRLGNGDEPDPRTDYPTSLVTCWTTISSVFPRYPPNYNATVTIKSPLQPSSAERRYRKFTRHPRTDSHMHSWVQITVNCLREGESGARRRDLRRRLGVVGVCGAFDVGGDRWTRGGMAWEPVKDAVAKINAVSDCVRQVGERCWDHIGRRGEESGSKVSDPPSAWLHVL